MMKDTGTLEYFLDVIQQQDTHKRLKVAEEIISYLSDPSNSIDFSGTEKLIDGLTAWAGSSNFRVSQYGLEILAAFAEKMGPSFKVVIKSVVPTAVDRLGDSKPQVREQAHNLLMKLMDPVLSPQSVFEILTNYFGHKNWRVRDELMHCLMTTINRFGASKLSISKMMPSICKLLGDPTSQVRETAVSTIVVIYRHVGERVRADLGKRGIPSARLNTIFAKFDECLASGNMAASSQTSGDRANGEVDSVDSSKPVRSTSLKRTSSVRQPKRTGMDRDHSASSGSSTGAVDESDFITAWEETPEVKVYSPKDMLEEINKINNVLSNSNHDWEQRVASIKRLRGLVKMYGDGDHTMKLLKTLEGALRTSIKDLRSQIVRETCVTLSYFASLFGSNFDYLAEALLPTLLSTLPLTVKIMSTSGHASIRLIIKNTAAHKLIPIFVSNLLTNKSKEIRRRCAEYIDLFLETWDSSVLKGHVALLEEAIRKGVADQDSETRAAVRRAFWHFADHYKERANNLMETLDNSKQKLLQSDKNLLQAGLSRPASSYARTVKSKSVKSARVASDHNNEDRSMMPPPTRKAPPSARDASKAGLGMQRSSSHLEKRQNAPRMEPRQKSCDEFARGGRLRVSNRRPGPAVSQPTSRSGSPSRRIPMPTFTRERSEDYMKINSPLKTRIPTPRRSTSKSNSRPQSPNRSRNGSSSSVQVSDLRGRRINGNGAGKLVTEDDLWDAYEKSTVRRRFEFASSQNHSSDDEDSETSSVCSERSSSSHNLRRGPVSLDINEILRLLNSPSWSERRDGITSLQSYLQGIKRLSLDETLRIKDAFNKFFSDPQSKVFSIFLDVLSEYIVLYRSNLQDWLFILLTRLLQKLGNDMLPSVHSKVARVLDVVRDSFPYDQQFQILTKYITDNTQTPNLKMKIAFLHYLQGLINLMDPTDFVNTGATRLAVSRIITWTSEPKSGEVRKEAAAVVVALFDLNTPEFSMMLSVLPNSFQDGAAKLLHNHLKPSQSQASQRTPGPAYDEVDYVDYSSGYTYPSKKDTKARLGYRSISPNKHPSSDDIYQPGGRDGSSYDNKLSPPYGGRANIDGEEEEDDSSRSLGSVARTKLDFSPRTPGKSEFEGTPVRMNPHGQDSEASKHRNGYALSPAVNQSANESSFLLSKVTPPIYDPKHYADNGRKGNGLIVNGSDQTYLSPEMVRVADGAEEPDPPEPPGSQATIDIINQIMTVLSSRQGDENASEDIKCALLELIKLVRAGVSEYGTEIRGFVPIIRDILRHPEATIRCLAARSIREIVRSLPQAFAKNIANLVETLLETQADAQKEVSKTAEECCNLLAESASPIELVSVLYPIIDSPRFPVNVAAIRMLAAVTERYDPIALTTRLADVVPPLLKAYDHPESSVRKACVFCLVAVHNRVGQEAMSPHLKDLSGSKMKLLNLYIHRSQKS